MLCAGDELGHTQMGNNNPYCQDNATTWIDWSEADGDMQAYLDSLAVVRARDFEVLWPTHGPPIRDVAPFLDAYRAHRLTREAQVLDALAKGPSRIRPMVARLYASVDARLHPAAAPSVWAHLIKLAGEGRVRCDGDPGLESEYRLA